MPAILAWFASALFAGAASEIFKKAVVFVVFNIILQFFLAYITNHGVDGLSPLGVGSSLSSLIAQVADPRLVYVMDCFYVIPGLFLILNAYLARFAYRLTLAALRG